MAIANVPLLQKSRFGITSQLAYEIVIARSPPGVGVLVVIALELQIPLILLRIDLALHLTTFQSVSEATTVEDVRKARETRSSVELQGDLAGEVDPQRHLFLLAW